MCEGTVRIILKGAIILVHSCCSHGAGVCPHTPLRTRTSMEKNYFLKKNFYY